jgi:hypothetical protein
MTAACGIVVYAPFTSLLEKGQAVGSDGPRHPSVTESIRAILSQ